jgi:hypothetical protein
VEVDNTEDAIMHLLEPDPVLDSAQIIADVKFAGRLDSRKNARHLSKVPSPY